MKKSTHVQALRNPNFRATLADDDRARLVHPAGISLLDDEALKSAAGGVLPRDTRFVDSCVRPGQQCP